MQFSKKIRSGVVALIAILVASIALGGCITNSSKQPDAVSDPNQLYSPLELTDNDFESVLNNSSFFVLDFYYPGCGPCKSVNNTISELSNELQGQIEFGRMNVREKENNQTVKKYKVSTYPTLLFFDEGVLVSRMKGNTTKSSLLAELKDLKPGLDTGKVKLQPGASGDIALAEMGETKPTKPMLITDSNIDSAAKKYPYLVIDGFTTWCEHCKPSNITLEQLSSELKGQVAFGLIDIDKNKATKARYNITSYPTLLIFKDGEFQGRLIGNKGKSILVSELKKYYPDLDTRNVNLTQSSTAAKAKAAARPKLTPEQACANMTKSDKPLLEAFVVSQCPFGLQVQRIMAEIVSNSSLAEDYLKVRYIGSVSNNTITSMHGDKEAQENLRQICIREEQSGKYWDYVRCYMREGKSAECQNSISLDIKKLDSCTNESGRGLVYAQKDFDLANRFEITGSPTMLMNDEIVKESNFATNTTNGRSPEALKELLCCGFKEETSFCSLQMNTSRMATMFSAN
jgi:thioredoxin 1